MSEADEMDPRLVSLLGNFAEKLLCASMAPEHVAKVFLSTGITVAVSRYGNVMAAEWLRDVADAVERGQFRGLEN